MNKVFLAGLSGLLAVGVLAGVAVAAVAPGERGGGRHGRGFGPDGTISLSQLRANAAERFKRLDSNGDGALSFVEFNARSADRLARLDTNKDGKLSREESRAGREAARARRQKNS